MWFPIFREFSSYIDPIRYANSIHKVKNRLHFLTKFKFSLIFKSQKKPFPKLASCEQQSTSAVPSEHPAAAELLDSRAGTPSWSVYLASYENVPGGYIALLWVVVSAKSNTHLHLQIMAEPRKLEQRPIPARQPNTTSVSTFPSFQQSRPRCTSLASPARPL